MPERNNTQEEQTENQTQQHPVRRQVNKVQHPPLEYKEGEGKNISLQVLPLSKHMIFPYGDRTRHAG